MATVMTTAIFHLHLLLRKIQEKLILTERLSSHTINADKSDGTSQGAMSNMGDRVGKQLGNYRLIRLLGKGGFAEVYLGEHIYLNTQAAIKVLSTHLTDNELEQ